MTVEREREHQVQLEQVIYELSEYPLEDTEVIKMLVQLRNIYANGFRHSYADLFSVISSVKEHDKLVVRKYNSEYLLNNLQSLRKVIDEDYEKSVAVSEKTEYSALYKHFRKLCDHVNLEICRMDYFTTKDDQIKDRESQVERMTEKVSEVNEEIIKLKSELNIAKDTIEKSQTTAITVIGLFSAIIMSFFGGISFTDQSLTILSDSSPIRLVFVLALVGFTLFNLLFLILYIVGKLTGRKICSQCLISTDKTKKICTCIKQSFWCKMTKRYPYVLWTNCILVFLLVCMSVIWISTLFFNRTINAIPVVIITVSVALVFVVAILIVRGISKKIK